ncbi:hypothetical protein [Streptomyces sp. NPDC005476]|uniref:hypothetical protein n=1 Tax=Streptomyces sp. NPDC005476 TaxID=3156882 RepID=UPI0034525A5D
MQQHQVRGVEVLAAKESIQVVDVSQLLELTAPAETEPSHVEFEMNFQLYGAITATKAVLPAMQETGAGTLLHTTGAGSIQPDPRVANVNAAAALRNWAMNLHQELDGTGIQAAHVAMDSSIGVSVIPGVEAAEPEQIAPLYWELHTTRRAEAELVFRLDAGGFPRA